MSIPFGKHCGRTLAAVLAEDGWYAHHIVGETANPKMRAWVEREHPVIYKLLREHCALHPCEPAGDAAAAAAPALHRHGLCVDEV